MSSATLLRPLRHARCRLQSAAVRPTASAPHQQPLPASAAATTHISTRSASLRSVRHWYQSLWQPRQIYAPYRHVTQVGDPVLRRPADPVPSEAITSPEIRFLVDRMVEVMRAHKCVGLAAPQVGTGLRVLVMELTAEYLAKVKPEAQKEKQMVEMPLTVLINPKMQVTNYSRVTFAEGCASIRGYSADVERYEECTVTGYDCSGHLQTLELRGWTARIFQHELDHLNGVLFTDIMVPRTLACISWQEVNEREGRVRIEFGAAK